MYTKRIVNKVPGEVLAESKKEKLGYIGDFSLKTTIQLKEILDRQKKLLNNRAFIRKLEDKGDKITKLKEQVEEELLKREKNDNLTSLMSGLSVNDKTDLDGLEWTGKSTPKCLDDNEEINAFDDEDNPLRILATHSGAGFHKKKHKVIKPEKPLINPSDLSFENNSIETEDVLEEYAKNLCEKLDSVNKNSNSSDKFLPNKTLKKPLPISTERRKPGCHWEVTAATPPPPVFGDTKLVSLQESIKLQTEQQLKLKEIQMKHATDRLAASQHLTTGQLRNVLGTYRDPGSGHTSESETSEAEVLDDDEYPESGGVVVYNIVDDIRNG